MATMLGDPGSDYNKLIDDRRAFFGPSADPMGSLADQNTGEDYGWISNGVDIPGQLQRAGTPPAGSVAAAAKRGMPAAGYGGLGVGGGGAFGGLAPSAATGSAGSYAGGGGSVGGYELPGSAAASQSLRDLQMGALGGLQGLMSQDTTAQRDKIQQALYETASRGINAAADRARQAMLEGTFGRGVGSSTISLELAGRQQQEQSDALAQAARDAYTQAGSEQRADLASQLGLNSTSFNAATAGLQGEANVALTNLAREQQANQFAQNLGFQGSENAANRAQAASQFGSNLGLSYAQLGQQASQFGANQAFQGSENAANRAQATSEAELNRQLQELLLQNQQTFAGGQNQAARDAAAAAQASAQAFTGQQNQAGQTFTGQQNTAARDAQMQALLLQLANNRDIASNNATAGGLSAAGSGLGALLGPALAQIAKGWVG